MLLKKKGFPEEDELVMCTVTKVQFHSVFCNLDEYDKGLFRDKIPLAKYLLG